MCGNKLVIWINVSTAAFPMCVTAGIHSNQNTAKHTPILEIDMNESSMCSSCRVEKCTRCQSRPAHEGTHLSHLAQARNVGSFHHDGVEQQYIDQSWMHRKRKLHLELQNRSEWCSLQAFLIEQRIAKMFSKIVDHCLS